MESCSFFISALVLLSLSLTCSSDCIFSSAAAGTPCDAPENCLSVEGAEDSGAEVTAGWSNAAALSSAVVAVLFTSASFF